MKGNYCWLTGEALGVDHTQISFSARALTSGYGCGDDKAGLDVQYFRLKNFNYGDDSPPVPWDFSYTPKIVVINLGQNDQCGSESSETMTASYVGFMQKIRAKFPQAQIAALRTFGGPYEASIRQAVATLTSTGDRKVHYIDTTGWLEKDDFKDGIHPNDAGNVKAARRLAPLLRPLLGVADPVPTTATVGDPSHPGALSQQVLHAYIAGAKRIVVRPGTYVMPDVGQTALSLDGWANTTLMGTGVTLILTDLAWMHDGIDLNRCTHVTVQGFLLSQNKITSYQGRVIAVGKGDDGKPYCDWRPDKGYPVPPADEKAFLGGDANVVDAHTRLLKVGCGDFYGVAAEALPNGTFRAHMGGHFGVGDWLVGRCGDAPFKVFLSDSRSCTIKDVTMMRNGFANIREDNGGGNHILGCKWVLGPRPAGAVEEPLVTNAADGFHSTGTDVGPDIEDCTMEGVFLDDNFAIHGSLQTVKSATGTVLTLEGGIGNLAVGQPVRISDNKGFYAEGTVTALKENSDQTTTVTLDKDLGVPAGAKLSNPKRNGSGYQIIGCHLGRTRSRGILVKADHGLIKDNIIESCGMSAVSIGPEYDWGEADYAHHIIVEGNRLRQNGLADYGGAAILIHGDGAIGNQDIVIHNNRMTSDYQGEADIEWADGVTLSGNVIIGASSWPTGIDMPFLITLSNCRHITFSGNVVHNTGVYKPDLVAVGANATGIQNNGSAGVRTLAGP